MLMVSRALLGVLLLCVPLQDRPPLAPEPDAAAQKDALKKLAPLLDAEGSAASKDEEGFFERLRGMLGG